MSSLARLRSASSSAYTCEVLEETGCAVGRATFACLDNAVARAERYHYVVAFVLCETSDEPANLEPDKCAGWRWVRWDDADGDGGFPTPLFTSLANVRRAGYRPPFCLPIPPRSSDATPSPTPTVPPPPPEAGGGAAPEAAGAGAVRDCVPDGSSAMTGGAAGDATAAAGGAASAADGGCALSEPKAPVQLSNGTIVHDAIPFYESARAAPH